MKISVVTGTRAEFGLLSGLMRLIHNSPELDLQVVVTGMHLLPEFGHTVDAIIEAGFQISREVPAIRHAATGADVSHQVGAGVSEFTDAFLKLEPDALVVLGDRYEMLAASLAAFFLEIPILHIHGGEVTHGAFDDTIRHVLTKFSTVHCVAHSEYAARVLQLGEQPDSVHVVGGLGIDQLATVTLKNRGELEKDLGIGLRNPLFLVTYHPVTRGVSDAVAEVRAVVAALESIPDATVIATMPNADPDHQLIVDVLQMSVRRHPGQWLFAPSLGQANYWSVMALATAVVGNSSSGILEAPSFPTATVNIGPRQEGRIFADSVVSVDPEEGAILSGLTRVMSADFMKKLSSVTNPFGPPGASVLILEVLRNICADTFRRKLFYDQPNHLLGVNHACE